jgi:hypothetical protein
LINKCLQVKNFRYLGCEISYENDKDIKKLATFSQIPGIPNSTSKPTLVQKFSRMEVYNAVAFTTLYTEAKFGHEEQRIKRLTSIEIKFFKRT